MAQVACIVFRDNRDTRTRGCVRAKPEVSGWRVAGAFWRLPYQRDDNGPHVFPLEAYFDSSHVGLSRAWTCVIYSFLLVDFTMASIDVHVTSGTLVASVPFSSYCILDKEIIASVTAAAAYMLVQ